MKMLQIEENEESVLDLGAHRRGELTESVLSQMGAKIKYMLGAMFKGAPVNTMLRGNRQILHRCYYKRKEIHGRLHALRSRQPQDS